MRSATIFRALFFSALVTGLSVSTSMAQEAPRRTAPAPTTKDGGTVTTLPSPAPNAPVYRPSPDQTSRAPVPATPAPQSPLPHAPAPVYSPAPVYRPAPGQTTTQAPSPQQQTTIDRRYDINGDGVISKAERKQMKQIRKTEKEQARELRKAEHSSRVEEHKREMAAQGLEARQHALKAHGNGHGSKK